ncbi:hypothetical protein ACJX0J_007612 [Zea mays]
MDSLDYYLFFYLESLEEVKLDSFLVFHIVIFFYFFIHIELSCHFLFLEFHLNKRNTKDLGQDYSYARDRILRDMTKFFPFEFMDKDHPLNLKNYNKILRNHIFS